ncbi:MAG: peptide chain release factor aRF-1 [Candidatus Anstonellales archaeon]
MSEEKKKHKLKRLIKSFETFRGGNTELISVYVPKGYPIHEVRNRLREEMNQAGNIKSKTTRTNVQDALEKILAYLKFYNQTPENGLAVFAGNVSSDPSKRDIQLFAVDPPYPIDISVYRCDSTFFMEPLKKMLDARQSYGLIAMDGREATFGILKGTNLMVITEISSFAHSKVRKGGQSARRYERLIEEQREIYYKKIGETMDKVFLETTQGVIIGGPGPAKEDFLKMRPFNYQIKILGVVNTGYTDEYGLREIVNSMSSILDNQEAVKEKKIVNRFLQEVIKDGLATYGYGPVKGAILSKQASLVMLSEGLEMYFRKYRCRKCRQEFEVIEKKNERQKHCGDDPELLEDKDLVEYLSDLAEEMQIEVALISTDTDEGIQFLNGYGGIGALLRYK